MLKPIGMITGLLLLAAGCATTPKTPEKRQQLQNEAQNTLNVMKSRDARITPLLNSSYAYVIFPKIGKGGVLVGGAYGRGVVYQNGQLIGYAELNQASIGAQLGGQTFSQLILFRDQPALETFKRGGFSSSAAASVVALTTGLASKVDFGRQGTAIIVMPRGGLMGELSLAGQTINYQPKQI